MRSSWESSMRLSIRQPTPATLCGVIGARPLGANDRGLHFIPPFSRHRQIFLGVLRDIWSWLEHSPDFYKGGDLEAKTPSDLAGKHQSSRGCSRSCKANWKMVENDAT